MLQYYVFHKPYEVLTQFTTEGNKKTLADYIKGIPVDVYPVGRLDYDSEGLLLLTNDKQLTHRLLTPAFNHTRTYWVQVDGQITDEAISRLQQGVTITIDGKPYTTKKSKAVIIDEPTAIGPRNPPVRYRKHIPTSWIALTLTEGKNRQVRRMTAAVGYPTLRLIRYAIGGVTLDTLQAGEFKQLNAAEVKQLLVGGSGSTKNV